MGYLNGHCRNDRRKTRTLFVCAQISTLPQQLFQLEYIEKMYGTSFVIILALSIIWERTNARKLADRLGGRRVDIDFIFSVYICLHVLWVSFFTTGKLNRKETHKILRTQFLWWFLVPLLLTTFLSLLSHLNGPTSGTHTHLFCFDFFHVIFLCLARDLVRPRIFSPLLLHNFHLSLLLSVV